MLTQNVYLILFPLPFSSNVLRYQLGILLYLVAMCQRESELLRSYICFCMISSSVTMERSQFKLTLEW